MVVVVAVVVVDVVAGDCEPRVVCFFFLVFVSGFRFSFEHLPPADVVRDRIF